MAKLTFKHFICIALSLSPFLQYAHSMQLNDIDELIVALSRNGVSLDHQSIILKKGEKIYIHEDDWQYLRLKTPKSFVEWQSQTYYPVHAYQDIKVYLDEKTYELKLDIPARYFQTSELSPTKRQVVTPIQNSRGAYVNYDILYDIIDNQQNIRGIFDITTFSSLGSFNTQHLMTQSSDENSFIRLSSQWRIDHPDKMRTIVIGDSNTFPGNWGGSVLYGGIQIRTNFASRPDFIPYPNQIATGTAALPSSVDLYLENINLFQDRIDPGPFNIQFQPPSIGYNEVNVVTTDILGRQRIVNLPFYASNQILKPSVHEYAIDIGFARRNFGLEDFDYGQPFFTLNDKVGLSNRFTTETRIEGSEQTQAFGLSGYYLLGKLGLISTTAATSMHRGNLGQLFAVGFDRSASTLSYGFRIESYSSQFLTVADSNNIQNREMLIRATLGYPTKQYGAYNISFLHQLNRQGEDITLTTLNYSKQLWYQLALNINATYDITDNSRTAFFINITKALTKQHTASMNFRLNDDDSSVGTNLQKNLERGEGLGYTIDAQKSEQNEQLLANLRYQNDYGYYSSEYDRSNEQNNFRFNWQGSMTVINGHYQLSRPVNDAFALISTPGFENINIYHDNALVAKTNRKGFRLLPDVTSFTENTIQLSGEELPLNINVKQLRQSFAVLPKQGVLIEFPLSYASDALVTLQRENGEPLPPGSRITSVDMPDETLALVAYAGEAYLTGLKGKNDYIAIDDKGRCHFTIEYQANAEELQTDLGVVLCH